MGWIYQLAHGAAFVTALPFYAARRGGWSKYREVLGPRFGRPPIEAPTGSLWIQAVSVGEVGVADILVRALRPLRNDLPILVTTTTVTGQARARAAFPDDSVGYFPFDFSGVVRKTVRDLGPRAFVMVETEIWPGVIEELSRSAIPVILANARISDRSFPRYRKIARFLRPTLDRIDRALASSSLDAERLVALGLRADRIDVTGNLKFDRERPELPLPWTPDLARIFGGRSVLVAGSTAEGEEEAVLDAYRFATSGGKSAGLIVAPRHPNRFDEVARLCAAAGFRVARRSEFTPEGRFPDGAPEADVLLLDVIGELSRAYRGASAAFVGGSFARRGGHNPIEASLFGVPVAVGPHTENFRDVVDTLERGGGLVVAEGTTRLGVVWNEWLTNPAAARAIGAAGRKVVEESRGAAARTAAIVANLVPVREQA